MAEIIMLCNYNFGRKLDKEETRQIKFKEETRQIKF